MKNVKWIDLTKGGLKQNKISHLFANAPPLPQLKLENQTKWKFSTHHETYFVGYGPSNICQIAFSVLILPHSGSILDSQQSWKSGKFQLARWSHKVAIFSVRVPPPSHQPPKEGLDLVLCPHLNLNIWTVTPSGTCSVPPLLLKHLRIVCGVPT